jgi:hypothetical protein
MEIYTKSCPNCRKPQIYKYKKFLLKALEKNQLCRSCGNKGISRNKGISKGAGSKNYFYGSHRIGKLNPFYGKHHSLSSINKISQKNKGKRSWLTGKTFEEAYGIERAKEIKQKNKNQRYLYDIWVEKYGREEADIMWSDRLYRLSLASSGSNNPMYGKPSPIKSGNGWSGWYKGIYFRSLLELSYIINVIEAENLNAKSAESKELAIKYIDFCGVERNYFADFLIDEHILIECKPKNLIFSKSVQLKIVAAVIFCKNNNLEYKIECPSKLQKDIIKKLHDSGELKFIEKYERNFDERMIKYR